MDGPPLDEPQGCGPLICGIVSAVTGFFYFTQIHWEPRAPHYSAPGTWPAMPPTPMVCFGLVLLLVNVVGGAVAIIGGAISLRGATRNLAHRRAPAALTAILLGLVGWAGLIALFLFDQ